MSAAGGRLPIRIAWARLLALVVFCLGALAIGGATAAHAQGQGVTRVSTTDPRERNARKHFADGNFTKALELYTETLIPTYVRNLARCQQKLGDADEAITSFRDYLRKAPNVSPNDRAEIEGSIAGLEALKTQQERARASSST